MTTHESGAADAALDCLVQLAASSEELYRTVSRFREQADVSGNPRGTRGPYGQMLPIRERLDMVERISTAVRRMAEDAYRFRRAEARSLYAEGLTMKQLAVVFGVSRQRVSALLREAGAGQGDRGGGAPGDGGGEASVRGGGWPPPPEPDGRGRAVTGMGGRTVNDGGR